MDEIHAWHESHFNNNFPKSYWYNNHQIGYYTVIQVKEAAKISAL